MSENVSTELSHRIHKRQVVFFPPRSEKQANIHSKTILKFLVAVDEQLTTSRRVVLELGMFF